MKARSLAASGFFALAVIMAAGSATAATNLIQNGGFETGDFTDWNLEANYASVGTANNGRAPHSGLYFAELGDVYFRGTLSQDILDIAGQTYTLSYFLQSDGGMPSYFDATWDGNTIAGSIVYDLPDQLSTGYVKYSFNVVGTGSDTVLFHEQDVPGALDLDDVSLSVSAAPEPSTWALMIAGVAVAGLALRRRRPGATLAAG